MELRLAKVPERWHENPLRKTLVFELEEPSRDI
jgi:hypothetical protein